MVYYSHMAQTFLERHGGTLLVLSFPVLAVAVGILTGAFHEVDPRVAETNA
jgi:hypothetical protein